MTRTFDTDVLPEVHEHYSYQFKLAEKGYWSYDFALPLLVLNALYHHTNKKLVEWLRICPHKQITALDTHDGIGVVDVRDLLAPEDIDRTIEGLYQKGSNVKRIYSGPEYQNLDIYQVNCTYYSALESNDDSYLTARTIQFFAPGIPQVYYVGLLAGENDIEMVEKTQSGRNINRHNYDLDEIQTATEKPAVKRLLKLMEFRNTFPAFNGEFRIHDSDESELVLSWTMEGYQATAIIDLANYQTRIQYHDAAAGHSDEFRV
ncbi:MAG: sucrose phosphorylase [Desulfobacterales bacterium]|nr:sucrose phosphorylase [Desulfobacterales bacterium]